MKDAGCRQGLFEAWLFTRFTHDIDQLQVIKPGDRFNDRFGGKYISDTFASLLSNETMLTVSLTVNTGCDLLLLYQKHKYDHVSATAKLVEQVGTQGILMSPCCELSGIHTQTCTEQCDSMQLKL